MRRKLSVLALAALLSAGCGATAPPAAGGTTDRDKGVQFAECMRGNGVPDFPDPNASGDFEFGVDVTPEVWEKALGACRELQPPGTLDARRSPEQQAVALEFAQCVRDNGVPDFPDPVNGEPLINTYKIPSANREGGMTILNAATKKCGDLLAKAAGGKP